MATGFYNDSLALLTDLYQLTMAYGYWKLGRAEEEAAFNLFFRKHPFQGGFTIAAGLQYLVDYVRDLRFAEDDLAYLATLTGNDGKPMFEAAFLDYLQAMAFTVDIDAIPEGTVVFPHEPLLRVKGPHSAVPVAGNAAAQHGQFPDAHRHQSGARVPGGAQGEPVTEFGLRRAQGIDGGLAATPRRICGRVHLDLERAGGANCSASR